MGTAHADMFLMAADLGVVVLYPDLVNSSFVRYLQRMKFRIIEVSPKEYWV